MFFTGTLQYFQGNCETCLIDNRHVVVLKGTSPAMVQETETAAFTVHYGFRFANAGSWPCGLGGAIQVELPKGQLQVWGTV